MKMQEGSGSQGSTRAAEWMIISQPVTAARREEKSVMSPKASSKWEFDEEEDAAGRDERLLVRRTKARTE